MPVENSLTKATSFQVVCTALASLLSMRSPRTWRCGLNVMARSTTSLLQAARKHPSSRRSEQLASAIAEPPCVSGRMQPTLILTNSLCDSFSTCCALKRCSVRACESVSRMRTAVTAVNGITRMDCAITWLTHCSIVCAFPKNLLSVICQGMQRRLAGRLPGCRKEEMLSLRAMSI